MRPLRPPKRPPQRWPSRRSRDPRRGWRLLHRQWGFRTQVLPNDQNGLKFAPAQRLLPLVLVHHLPTTDDTAQYSSVQFGTAQFSAARYQMVHSTAQCSAVECCAVQYPAGTPLCRYPLPGTAWRPRVRPDGPPLQRAPTWYPPLQVPLTWYATIMPLYFAPLPGTSWRPRGTP